MRTTVTLDADVEALLHRQMSKRGISFKVAVNDAIRSGLAPKKPVAFVTPSSDMGLPTVSLDRALALAAELEDEEMVRKQRVGK